VPSAFTAHDSTLVSANNRGLNTQDVSMFGSLRSLVVTVALAFLSSSATAQILAGGETLSLGAFDGLSQDEYGKSVARSGDTLAVGAWTDWTSTNQGGSVYIYVRSGSNWVLQQKIAPQFPSSQYRFGESLALEGDRLVVGSSWDHELQYQSGAVYVFERTGGVWSQTAKLKGSAVSFNRNLGRSVALDGDTIAAGATYACCATSPSGAVHVFRRIAGVWTEEARLTGSASASSQAFGESVSLDGDRLAVGRPQLSFGTGNSPGAIHVFQRSGSAWSEVQRIDSPVAVAGVKFGFDVALEGSTLVAGMPKGPSMGGAQSSGGRVDVFAETAGVWTHVQTLDANDGAPGELFGYAIDLDGDVLAVGAPCSVDVPSSVGAGYVFERVAGVWRQTAKLITSRTATAGGLGASVALEGNEVWLGALVSSLNGPSSGSVSLFTLPVAQLGVRFCFGDGSAGVCSCANASAPGNQLGCLNTFGLGSWIIALGSASAAADDLIFEVHGTNGATVLFGSAVAIPAAPFGGGLICVASPRRLGAASTFLNRARFGPGLGVTAGWAAGQTWSFQVLHREPFFAPACLGGKNSSSGLQLTIAP
jgi:hypothetical protein